MRYYYRLISTVIIEDGNTSTKVSESDIIYIEAQLRITLVHTVSGVYPTKMTIHSWKFLF